MKKQTKNNTKEVKNTEEVVIMENVETVNAEVMGMEDLTIEELKLIQDLRIKAEKKEKSILTKGGKLGMKIKDKVMESKRNKIIAGVGAGLAIVGAAAAVVALGGSEDEEVIEGEWTEGNGEELERIENNETHEYYHGVHEDNNEIETIEEVEVGLETE